MNPSSTEALREQAKREPLETDISDFGDEWCAGFLAGQVNAIDFLAVERAESAEVRRVLGEGVKLLRTVYSSAGDFAYVAREWAAEAEAVLDA